MKIAIPTRNNEVDDHFGHCEAYSIYTIDKDKQIIKQELIPSVGGCGCKSNIALILQEKGVSLMLAGGIGSGAVNVLKSHGIDVIRGCAGNVEELLKSFLVGQVIDTNINCQHTHEEGHTCSH